VEENVLDINSILIDCGLESSDTTSFCQNLVDLGEKFNDSELVSIYTYCLLNIKNSEILTQVIKLADAHKSKSILTILINLLSFEIDSEADSDVNLRVLIIKAIANYKDFSTVNSLLACMNNKKEHYKVRLACADALGRIGDRYAVKPLIDLVEDEEEKSVYLKESATFALGLLGDTSAIDPLISILESKQGLLGKFTFLKEKIVEALGKLNINNKKVLKALKNSLMDSSSMVRINAIEAIMNSGDEASTDLIRPSLQDEDDDVKKNALIALYNLIGRDILDEVIELPIYTQFLKDEAQSLIDEYENEEDYE